MKMFMIYIVFLHSQPFLKCLRRISSKTTQRKLRKAASTVRHKINEKENVIEENEAFVQRVCNAENL